MKDVRARENKKIQIQVINVIILLFFIKNAMEYIEIIIKCYSGCAHYFLLSSNFIVIVSWSKGRRRRSEEVKQNFIISINFQLVIPKKKK